MMKSSRLGERRWCTIIALVVVVIGLLCLFILYPILDDNKPTNPSGLSIHHIRRPSVWIDSDTPEEWRSLNFSNTNFDLVFSDEFNQDGRSFGPGEDKAWEAVNLPSRLPDLTSYNSDAITTQGGSLVITLTADQDNSQTYSSGMLQSWNKFCFTGGFIQARVSFPVNSQGLSPSLWTMGNLARPGYPATTDGVWPYSYDSCDAGITQQPPISSLHSQKLNKCLCKNDDTPSPGKGRGAPEIDLIGTRGMEFSQSFKVAPFDNIHQTNEEKTAEVLSANIYIPNDNYHTYGFKYQPGPDGYIQWYHDDYAKHRMSANDIGPDPSTNVTQRLIPEEPMSIIVNLAVGKLFQSNALPVTMNVDYIRVYQDRKSINIGCDPEAFPTAAYIKKHSDIYNNSSLTAWPHSFPGYSFSGVCV
ncbi:hypothetical protein K7432_011341 [Basidiobolus ranarum]|uniref:GH16 domain-containing protein n=1 Tax=Basidiobolus ranarum TaxID=34480 RepID=A0ABR2WMH6_9FUNG